MGSRESQERVGPDGSPAELETTAPVEEPGVSSPDAATQGGPGEPSPDVDVRGPWLRNPLILAALFALSLDVFLLVLKFGTWWASGSPSIYADAWHGATDFVISLMVLGSLTLEHYLGRRRARAARLENVTAAAVALFIIANGVHVALGSTAVATYETWQLWAGLGGTVLTVVSVWALARFKMRISKRFESLSFEAEGHHSYADLATSVGVLVTLLLALAGINLERVTAALIGLLILRIGFVLLWRSVRGFVRGAALDQEALHVHAHGRGAAAPLDWLRHSVGAGLAVVARVAETARRLLWRYVWLLAAVAALLWLGTGVHAVGVGEQGLHLCFGRLQGGPLGPGLHYHAPTPVCEHLVANVTLQRRITLGFDDRPAGVQAQVPSAYLWDGATIRGPWPRDDEEALKLTGESTIIDINAVVAYRIRDLQRWLLSAEEPEALLRSHLLASLVQRLAGVRLDAALTEERAELERSLLHAARDFCAAQRLGAQVDSVELLAIHPPIPVVPVYRSVASAREEREERVDRAQAFAAELLPRSRARAQGLRRSAQRYNVTQSADAVGQTTAFAHKQAALARHRELHELRLELEALASSLARAGRLYVLPHAGAQRWLSLQAPGAAASRAPASSAGLGRVAERRPPDGAAAPSSWVPAPPEPRRSSWGDPYPDHCTTDENEEGGEDPGEEPRTPEDHGHE